MSLAQKILPEEELLNPVETLPEPSDSQALDKNVNVECPVGMQDTPPCESFISRHVSSQVQSNLILDGVENEQANRLSQVAESYFGSVKVFKNILLVLIFFAILIPTVLAINFWQDGRQLSLEIEAGEQALFDLQAQYQELEAQKKAQEVIWGGSVADWVVHTEPLSYQTLYPDFYVQEPIGEPLSDSGTMYLTFDDGPSANTPQLLSILKSKDVKATFFVVGGDTEKQKQWMRDIVADGHCLGMHSHTHDYRKIYTSVESFLDDFYKLFRNIKEATGQAPTIFRFPGGSINRYNGSVYQEIIAEMLRRGFVYFDWNLSSGDATGNDVSQFEIIQNILNYAPAFHRGIVLFHDAPSKNSTVAALPNVIDGLRNQGFTFAPLSREVEPILFNYSDYQPN